MNILQFLRSQEDQSSIADGQNLMNEIQQASFTKQAQQAVEEVDAENARISSELDKVGAVSDFLPAFQSIGAQQGKTKNDILQEYNQDKVNAGLDVMNQEF